MSRTASRRGDHNRGDFNQPGPDGWNVAQPRAPAKAGDMSNFGKFKSGGSGMMTMGPSSVFGKKGGAGGNQGRDTPPPQGGSVSRAGSMANMFSALTADGSSMETAMQRTTSGRGSGRKPSVDINKTTPSSEAPPDTPMRKKLQLLPRSAPTKEQDEQSEDGTEPDSSAAAASVPAPMTDAQAKAKIDEDIKEIFSVRDVSEAEACFKALPDEHKSKLVDKLVSRAAESKDADVKLVADIFSAAADAKSCSPAHFESGFAGPIEFLEDIAIDAPQAYTAMAKLLRGAKLSQDIVEQLAGKIAVEGDPMVAPRDKLMKIYSSLA